ncbi:MAG: SIS domain-containing protein, partial [Erysipelotrichaceae bacterium]|nr:SIS domain-containing protein [Erysipelotrichaceae bacterium]
MSEKTTMLTYIKETPSQVDKNVKNRKELVKDLVNTYLEKEYRTVWIVACGSSNNGSQCAKPFMMEYLNCDVKITTPNSFIYGDNKCKEDDLVMVISQSGCSTNSIAALKKCRELGVKAIGLTGNVNSDFKDVSDLLIDWGVGTETVGYVTKGVTTLALFLMLFALEAGLAKKTISMEKYNAVVEELKKCPSYHETIQKETYSFLEKNIKALTSIRTVYSCGFKQGYGICTEAALKIGETVKVPSFAYEAEEYIHGPNLQLTPNYTVIFVDGTDEPSK